VLELPNYMKTPTSIFEEYYTEVPFYDRYVNEPNDAVTVIIPTVHTNELWFANLVSIYREIPVKQLLIGDGGCIDDTTAIAEKFPRVVVHNHRDYKSLGYSIRKLIEAVETDWFIYLHSDVYLPTGWFDEMNRHKGEYDWFGCKMRHTIMVEYDNDYGERPYAGSQMGKREAFIKGLSRIDDDFVYRQEDFVFSDIVAKAGYREGKLDNIFHYHQTIKKPSPFWNPKDLQVTISQSLSSEQEFRVWNTQARGIIKYLSPSSNWVINDAGYCIYKLIQSDSISKKEIYSWISNTNPVWLPIIKKFIFKIQLIESLRFLLKQFKGMFQFLLK
jgi:glycosyltransferase involved in cell wall biosynthesis